MKMKKLREAFRIMTPYKRDGRFVKPVADVPGKVIKTI